MLNNQTVVQHARSSRTLSGQACNQKDRRTFSWNSESRQPQGFSIWITLAILKTVFHSAFLACGSSCKGLCRLLYSWQVLLGRLYSRKLVFQSHDCVFSPLCHWLKIFVLSFVLTRALLFLRLHFWLSYLALFAAWIWLFRHVRGPWANYPGIPSKTQLKFISAHR